MMLKLSDRLDDFNSADFTKVIQKRSEISDVVDLSVGLPEEDTPKHIKKAGVKAIKRNHTAYVQANGISELRELLASKLAKENNINGSAENITIVPGLTTGLLLVYLALFDPGDEVIVFDPCYPPYLHLAKLAGATPITVNTLPTFQPDIPALEASITHATKAIIINSPNNPTGAVYSKETMLKIVAIAKKHNLFIISDEIYEYFTFDNNKHFSVGSVYENTITMNGFSKAYAMTGWRLGYIHAPLQVVDAVNQLQQYVVFSSSSIAQQAAIQALLHRPQVHEKYAKKRKYLLEELRKLGYEIHGLQGAFFAFLRAPGDMTDIEFCNLAMEHKLLILPGRSFSSRHGYFRLSYGTNMRQLKRGINILAELNP